MSEFTGKLIYNLVILLFMLISLFFTGKLMDFIVRRKQAIHLKFLSSFIKVFIVLIGIVLFGQQFSSTKDLAVELFKSTGLLVAVLGFAAQSVLADVIAGMVISFSKPYDIGSRITLVGRNMTGIVEDITLRHTVIKCFDNNRILVPNSIINKEVLQNSTFTNDGIASFIEIGIAYESDIQKAMAVMERVVLEEPLVLDERKGNPGKSFAVRLTTLADSSLILKTAVWTKDVDDSFVAIGNIKLRLVEEFRKEGISIPYPHIHLVQDKAEENEHRPGTENTAENVAQYAAESASENTAESAAKNTAESAFVNAAASTAVNTAEGVAKNTAESVQRSERSKSPVATQLNSNGEDKPKQR